MHSDRVRLDALRARFDRAPGANELPPAQVQSDDDASHAVLPDTDLANARRLAQRHGRKFRFTVNGGFFVWDGKRWAHDPKGIQMQALATETVSGIFDEIRTANNRDDMFRHAKRSQSKPAIDAMISLSRSLPGVPALITDFDVDPMLLNLTNGTMDFRSGTLRSHDRDDLLTKLVPIAYDPTAECDVWKSFLSRVMDNNEALYAYVQRLLGYLLTGKTTEQVLHFLYGLGANGKSVFCEIVADLLGDYAVICSPDLVMLKRHSGIPNDIARLRGARVALMNETSQESSFDEAKLKDLTGGDKLTARFLHQEFFDFRPTHKLIIRGNHKPAIRGTDEGMWRRLRLVPFTVQIPSEEQDRHLLDKLRDELPGILRWAIEGCVKWQRDGLSAPAVITEAVQAYRDESDTLGRFISEHCKVQELSQVQSSLLFQRYQQFSEQCGERWMVAKGFREEMERRGFEYKRTNGQRLFLGIELIVTEGVGLPSDAK